MSELQPGRYRHFKGNEYQVIGTATHSETGDTLVVYRPLYGDQALWVRPLAMFTETVERDGKVHPRFALTAIRHASIAPTAIRQSFAKIVVTMAPR